MPGSARDEAERLVAAVLAMASDSSGTPAVTREGVAAGLGVLGDLAGRVVGEVMSHGLSGSFGSGSAGSAGSGSVPPAEAEPGAGSAGASGGPASGRAPDSRSAGAARHGQWATGSEECCVCPVCRVIAAMRDPSPETAARLATGAGDLASGIASMMRAVSVLAGEARPAPRPATTRSTTDNADQTWQYATRNAPDGAWAAATNRAPADSARGPADAAGAAAGGDAWAAATADSASEAAAAEAERRAAAQRARAEEQAAAKARAKAAAAAAARRVEEAAASARTARAAAATAGTAGTAGADGEAVGGSGRTAARSSDVWAAAIADAGVGDGERAPTVDHGGTGDHDGVRDHGRPGGS